FDPCAEIFHLDIKPSNIGYIDNVPKLLDFGVAHMKRQVSSHRYLNPMRDNRVTPATDTDLGQDGIFVGTPVYWPPELMKGESSGEARDLWPTTLVLYECLVGSNLMRRASLDETLKALRTEGVPPIEASVSRCPRAVSRFFDMALSKSPKNQPGTARTLRHHLEE